MSENKVINRRLANFKIRAVHDFQPLLNRRLGDTDAWVARELAAAMDDERYQALKTAMHGRWDQPPKDAQ